MNEIQSTLGNKNPLLGINVGIAESGFRYFVGDATQQGACNVEQLQDVSFGCFTEPVRRLRRSRFVLLKSPGQTVLI
jgi:hypothetical protein